MPPGVRQSVKNSHGTGLNPQICVRKRFMQNLTCSSPGQGCPLEEGVNPMTVHQGDCVNLDSDDDTYQVIGVDGDHDRCWVRRWPLQSNEGSPVFEISLERIRQVG